MVRQSTTRSVWLSASADEAAAEDIMAAEAGVAAASAMVAVATAGAGAIDNPP
jgi:hypothetical protein